jgi:hypothetical protein
MFAPVISKGDDFTADGVSRAFPESALAARLVSVQGENVYGSQVD